MVDFGVESSRTYSSQTITISTVTNHSPEVLAGVVLITSLYACYIFLLVCFLALGTADAEITVPSVENPQLTKFMFSFSSLE